MILSTQTDYLGKTFSNEYAINLIAKVGYDAIDFSMFNMHDLKDRFYTDDYIKFAKEYKNLADSLGIYFNQAHAPFSFPKELGENYEKEIVPRVVRSMEIASILNAKIIIVHPLQFLKYYGNEDRLREINMDYYSKLLPYAKDLDIKIALENMFQGDDNRKYIVKSVCGEAKEFASYIDELNDEHFVACLDIGHVGLIGETADNAIKTLGHDRLKALHVHDNNYLRDQHTLPGCGSLDWNKITAALAEINYDGDFTFEADNFFLGFPKEFAECATEFMYKRGRQLVSQIEKMHR